jgi:hypothetical protein
MRLPTEVWMIMLEYVGKENKKTNFIKLKPDMIVEKNSITFLGICYTQNHPNPIYELKIVCNGTSLIIGSFMNEKYAIILYDKIYNIIYGNNI